MIFTDAQRAFLEAARGNRHVSVEYHPGKRRTVTHHASKKAAHAHGMAQRRAGKDVSVWKHADAIARKVIEPHE